MSILIINAFAVSAQKISKPWKVEFGIGSKEIMAEFN